MFYRNTALQDIHMIGIGLNPSLLLDALVKYLNQEFLAVFAFCAD